jgi:serine protease Do
MRFLQLLFASFLVCSYATEGDRQALLDSYAPMIERASKSVVYLMTAIDVPAGVASPLIDDPWFKPYLQYPQLGLSVQKLRRSLGSGVVVSNNGIIVTSAKFVQGRLTLKVVASDQPEPLDAIVLGTDQLADLAVLRVVADNLVEPIFADAAQTRSGDVVFAIGNPFGLEPVVSMGVVSALGKQLSSDRILQSDLYIHAGNVGGAVFNASGELLGIPSYLRGMNEREAQGGFFIPIDRAKAIAERIERSGAVKDAWLGIAVSDLSREMRSYFARDDGVLITAVEARSPAANAGLKKGDLLLLADSVTIGGVADFERILSTVVADRDMAFLFMRDKRLGEAILRVGRLEISGRNAAARSLFYEGVTLEALTPIWRERLGLSETSYGLVATEVDPTSLAAKSGLETGDAILQIDGKDVESLAQFQEAIANEPPSNFTVVRGGLAISVSLVSARNASDEAAR